MKKFIIIAVAALFAGGCVTAKTCRARRDAAVLDAVTGLRASCFVSMKKISDACEVKLKSCKAGTK